MTEPKEDKTQPGADLHHHKKDGRDDDPFALFTEWASPADEAAYADLSIKSKAHP